MALGIYNGKYLINSSGQYIDNSVGAVEYLNINQSNLEFSYDAIACTTNQITISSNIAWYVTVDTTEINMAYVDITSGSGDGYTNFFCGETNGAAFAHSSQVNFRKTSNNELMASCGIQQYANGQGCV